MLTRGGNSSLCWPIIPVYTLGKALYSCRTYTMEPDHFILMQMNFYFFWNLQNEKMDDAEISNWPAMENIHIHDNLVCKSWF
jgi:hypothetical protein